MQMKKYGFALAIVALATVVASVGNLNKKRIASRPVVELSITTTVAPQELKAAFRQETNPDHDGADHEL